MNERQTDRIAHLIEQWRTAAITVRKLNVHGSGDVAFSLEVCADELSALLSAPSRELSETKARPSLEGVIAQLRGLVSKWSKSRYGYNGQDCADELAALLAGSGGTDDKIVRFRKDLRQLHQSFTVAVRRAGGMAGPACDGDECAICADVAVLSNLVAAHQQEAESGEPTRRRKTTT